MLAVAATQCVPQGLPKHASVNTARHPHILGVSVAFISVCSVLEHVWSSEADSCYKVVTVQIPPSISIMVGSVDICVDCMHF